MRPYPHPDEHQKVHTLPEPELKAAIELLSMLAAHNDAPVIRVLGRKGQTVEVPPQVAAAWLDVLSLMATKGSSAVYAFDEHHEVGVVEASRLTGMTANAIGLAVRRGDLPARREGAQGFVFLKMKDVLAYLDGPARKKGAQTSVS